MSYLTDPVYQEIMNNPHTKIGRKAALKKLGVLPTDKVSIQTINRIRDFYSLGFEDELWAKIGKHVIGLTITDLKPVTVHPHFVLAGQDVVNYDKVKALLKLKVRTGLMFTLKDSDDPIIVVKGPHGYMSVNGHHRLRALQLRGDKRVIAYTLPDGHFLMVQVEKLFRRYGYITVN
jgi:hypothetical protein